VGAREDIYGALRELAAHAVAVLVVTSDYEEVVQAADRAYVMARAGSPPSCRETTSPRAGCSLRQEDRE
jgi:ABC-type sugar transport system ATPase subunit